MVDYKLLKRGQILRISKDGADFDGDIVGDLVEVIETGDNFCRVISKNMDIYKLFGPLGRLKLDYVK